ncbi:MAG TPA: serpin family protein, partial [Candidatus Saccharicenans sp.]|nr:serpin family protein [Candidatus Saccharicenans sp.]
MKNRSNHSQLIWALALFPWLVAGTIFCSAGNSVNHKVSHELLNEESEMGDKEFSPDEANLLSSATNQFAFELYLNLKDSEGNIFFSPFSLSTAMAMTYEGARGQTAQEIKQVFHYPDSLEVTREEFAEIINLINKKDKQYELHTANALWAQKGYPLLTEYVSTVEKYYGGKVTDLDFARETENSRLKINRWVEEQTNDRIKDLIPPGVLNELTRLVLTNAIYFKGNWENQFPKENTKEEEFMVTPEKKVKVPMMSIREKRFNYLENDELQLVELPYTGQEISMLVLLPKNDLTSLEPRLTASQLNEYKKQLRSEKIDIYLPKFKFETKYMMGGKKGILGRMGMPTAFSPAEADFSGINGRRDFYLSEVVHQAFVEVNEEGTEAAAATGLVVGVTMVVKKLVFRADHPFIF